MAFDLLLKAGSTAQLIEVTVRDATTGQGKTGVAPGSVTYSYRQRGASGASPSGACVAMTLGTWADHGWAEVDAANRPGEYQFGVPNAALSGTDAVTLRFKIGGAIDKEVKIVLTAVDLQDATAGGIARLDAAVSSVPASVWASATRTLSAAQSFDNIGQITVQPANLTQINGTAVSSSVTGSKAYLGVNVLYWGGIGNGVGIVAGYPAVAIADANSAGQSAIAAGVWAAANRSLTDKAGFALAATQAFNNTGQSTVLPANVLQINGTDAQSSVSAGKAYFGVNVVYWGMGNGVGTINGYPSVAVAEASSAGQAKLAQGVWDALRASYGVAGSFGEALDAPVSTRLAASSYGAPDNAALAAIKGQTDKLFFSDHGDGTYDVRSGSTGTVVVDNAAIATAVWSAGTRTLSAAVDINSNADITAIKAVTDAYVAPVNAGIAAIQTQTDQLAFIGGDVRATLDGEVAGVDAASIAGAVWANATRSLTEKTGFGLAEGSIGTSTFAAGAIDATVAPNLDAPVSSRMASFVYTAPDNAGIAAIRAQTDQLVFISGDLRATLDGEVVSAGVDNASLAASVWANATRTITGGTVDTVTSVTNAVTTADAASIAVIKAATDKIVFVDHGDGTWDVRVPVPGALTAADVWAHATRTLTDKAGFSLADGSIKTATFTAGAINTTVAPNLDAAVSSRMASFAYVAPDNAGIVAIQGQTDKLHFSPHGDGTFDVQGNATATVDTAAVATAVWANAARTITGGTVDTNNDKAGYSLLASQQTAIAAAVWAAPNRITTGGIIDTNNDKTGYKLAADQYTHIASAMWTDGERGQIRSALGLSGARKATDGDGVTDSIYRITSKLQFNSQSDVIASLDGETVHLNPMQNFNNIGQRDEVPAQDSTLRLRLTDARAAKVDNLDTPISTRSSHSPGDVWSFSDRTLTSFGSLVSDIAAAVWTFGSRTLTRFGSLVGDIWSAVSRSITAGTVDLSAQAKADVRAAADAALADYDPLTYRDAAFDRDQIIDQVEAVLAAVRVRPDAATIAVAVDALLTTNHGAGDWRDTSHGIGPVAYTVRVTDGTNPIAFASVRLSVGPVGISLTTGADGTAAFDMQPGTYTLRIAKLGYSGHTATVTISAEPAIQDYEAQVNPLAAISAPPDPDKCTAFLTTYDAVGNVQSGVDIEIRLVSPPPGNAQSFSAKPWSVTSSASGLVEVALMKDAAYQARRGSGEWHLLRTDSRDAISMPTVLSHPNR